jgi:hypothetical protein
MITEDYVSFETAKLLKEKGFVGECFAAYNGNGKLYKFIEEVDDNVPYWSDAPTIQIAMKWLREAHHIFIAINIVSHTTVTMEQKYYFFKLYRNRKLYNFPLNDSVKLYFSYEEACEAAIKYCLENLI